MSVQKSARILLRNSLVKNFLGPRYMGTVYKALKYAKFGEPMDVLELSEDCAEDPKGKEVLVKILASPINPADINTIQGKYPVKPKFPAVGGNECVGEVIGTGESVKNIQVGHHVLLIRTGLGTWRTHAVVSEEELMPISKDIGLAEAATLTVNPCTAFRMLKDFVKLSPGDTVIQNGATSGVGQAVHQLCKAWGINSVGVVRDRPGIQEVKDYLKCLGATEVFTEEEIRSTKLFKEGKLKKPKLALNCVGGKSATEISRHLEDKGTMVTYGGMSKEPVNIATAALIFKDIRFKGYWMTRWTKEHFQNPEQKAMFDELCNMIKKGQLKAAAHEFVPLTDYKKAEAALGMKSFGGKKAIFKMD